MPREITKSVHLELGSLISGNNINGDTTIFFEVCNFGEKGSPGLNIQTKYFNANGDERIGKRPLLTKESVEYMIENDVLAKALSNIKQITK